MQLDNHNQSESSSPANTGSVTGFPAEVGVQQNLTDFSLINSFLTNGKLKRDFYRYVRLPHRIAMSFVLGIAMVVGFDVLNFFWHLYLMIDAQHGIENWELKIFMYLPVLTSILGLQEFISFLMRGAKIFTKQLSTVLENQELGTLPFLIEALNQSRNSFLMTTIYKGILNTTTKLLSVTHNPDIPFIDASHHRILNRYLNAKGILKTPEFVEAILGAYQYLGIASDLRALKRFSRLKNISPTMINLANVAETAIIRRMEERDSVQTLLRTPTATESTLLRVSDAS